MNTTDNKNWQPVCCGTDLNDDTTRDAKRASANAEKPMNSTKPKKKRTCALEEEYLLLILLLSIIIIIIYNLLLLIIIIIIYNTCAVEEEYLLWQLRHEAARLNAHACVHIRTGMHHSSE